MSERFAAYINDAYLAWEHDNHRKSSQNDFSLYLGVKQTTLSGWMHGLYEPEIESCIQLAKILGPGVFEAAGRYEPMPTDVIISSTVQIQMQVSDVGNLDILAYARKKLAEEKKGTSKNGEPEPSDQ